MYDESQYRIKEIHPDGGIRHFFHDPAGNVIKVIEPEEYARKGEEGKGISYSYDEENRVKEVRDGEGTVLIRLVYDKKGRVRKEIDGEGFLSAKTDEKRYGTLYCYNDMGWLMEKREPIKKEEGEEILYALTRYGYDKEGNQTEECRYQEYVTEQQEPKEQPLKISFLYDKRNRLIQVEDHLGAVITYEYNCLNQCIRERTKTDEFRSRTIQYTYDAVGQLIGTEEYEEQYDAILSDWKRDKKKLKAVTTYQYDKNGNLSTILFPEGGREIREYDTIDQLWKIRLEDPRSGIQKETVFTYDKVGNCLTERDRKGILFYEYDLLNQMIRKEDREGGVQRFFYDRNGNLVRWIDADGYEQEGEQAAGVRFVYDEQGRFTKRYDPSGYLQEWNQYGKKGELLRQENGEGFLAEYHYDIGGRVTAITTAKAKKNCGMFIKNLKKY